MFSLGDFDGISSFSPTYDVLGADADGLFIRGRDSSWQDGMVYLDATIAGSGDLIGYKEWLMKAVLILSIRTIMSNKLSRVKSSYMLGNGIIISIISIKF